MPYKAEYELLENFVRVSIRGTRVEGRVPEDSSVVVDRTLELINESGLGRCLVVIDLAGPLSPGDAFHLVAMSERHGWPRDCRLAFVNLRPDSLDDTRFTEVVANNRAFPLRVFADEEEALDWLLADY